MWSSLSSANRDDVTSSLPTYKPVVSFSCLIAPAKTSSAVLRKTGEHRHLILPLILHEILLASSHFL
jgi:hypothetical protein